MKITKVFATIAVCMTGLLLASCGQKSTQSKSQFDSKKPLTMWVDLNQASAYRPLAKEFTAKYGIKVKVAEVQEADDALLKDQDTAADLIRLPHDQLGQLVESGAIYPNEKYSKQVKSEEMPEAVRAATYKNKLYGYPASIDAMMLYYDKRVFSADDVSTMAKLTSKGSVGLNLAEAGADYRITPWFVANGANLFGAEGNDPKGTTLNNKQGVDVLKWIAGAKANKNIVAVNADEISALKEGKIHALFTGVWNTENIRKILGNNMATADYPTNDFGDGTVSLKAFSGVPIFVVNSATKNPSGAMKLARFLTTKKSQLAISKTMGTVPANIEARKNSSIVSDPVKKTVISMTTAKHSVLMPNLPAMKNFWSNMNAILVDAYNGKLSTEQMQTKLDNLVHDVSDDKD